jgi:hypothetical protein
VRISQPQEPRAGRLYPKDLCAERDIQRYTTIFEESVLMKINGVDEDRVPFQIKALLSAAASMHTVDQRQVRQHLASTGLS